MSSAIFASTPAAIRSAAPSSAMRTRSACQGTVGSARPSSPAKSSRPRAPRSPSAERVPAAPPSSAARPRSAAHPAAHRRRAPPTSQPAAFSPNVVGTACCSSVRAGHRRVPVRSRERRATRPPRGRDRPGPARARVRATSIAAVSITSWLVAPRCTAPRRVAPRPRARSARTSGSAGVPAPRPSCEQLLPVVVLGGARGGDRRRRVAGMTPARAPGLRERALRVEHRREPRAPRHRLLQRGRDEQGREQRHPAKNVVCCRRPASGCRSEGRRPRRPRRGSRAVRARGETAPDRPRSPRLVREVHARHGPLEEPAGEDPDLDVRRLQPPLRPRHAPGLDGHELEPPVVLRPGAPEAAEAVLERDVLTVVGRMRVAAGRVRLPDLDHAVGNWIACGVHEPSAIRIARGSPRSTSSARDEIAQEPDARGRDRRSARV